MKIKTLFILILIAVFFVAITVTGFYFILLQKPKQNTLAIVLPDKLFGWKFPTPVKSSLNEGQNLFDFQIAYSSIRDPGGIANGLPIRLQIPIIGVDSPVEDAFITPDGRMDVPSGSVNVAWFALGPHPGQIGSAVIGGHFGINGSKKFVFYDLDKLKVGDKIYILDDKGETLAFQVRFIKLFDRNGDATTVFTSSDGVAHLNLITCEGVWNQVNGTYPQRRVVFTDQIPSEGIVYNNIAPVNNVAVPAIPVFSRSLGIGSEGGDVVALQNFLEQKGFLVIPQGIAKGFFGGLTRVAVSKYQTSVGLPSIGAFGPLTRAKLVFELGNKIVLPNTGNESMPPMQVAIENPPTSSSTQSSPTLSQMIIESVRSLYATPVDALITFLLIVLVVFIILKIIWG